MTERGWRRVALAAFLCVAATGALAADAPPGAIANPTLLPRAILALRGEEWNQQQLRLSYDRTRGGTPEAPLTVWVGADYFDVIDGPRQSIDDLRLRRRFVIDSDRKTLINLSLYGEVMFRRVELLRRLQIAEALSRQPGHAALPDSLDRFWIESELGMTWRGRSEAPAIIDERHQGNRVEFFHRGQEVASFEPGGRLVPDGLTHGFGAFLHNTLPLHPRIADALVASGQVPARLEFTSEASGKGERIVLTLRQAELARGAFPLPRHVSLVLVPRGAGDPDAALMRQVLPDMINAISGQAQGGPRPVRAYRVAIDAAIRRGDVFEAALRLTELALQWGREAASCDPGDGEGRCHPRREINRLLHADPRSSAMFKAAALEDTAPDKAIEAWRRLDGQDVPGDYVVDVFLARLLSKKGARGAAARSFMAAFDGDPYLPVDYRELGNHFARVSRLDLAWLCYDLGRALPNRRSDDALAGIDEVEQEMVKTYPDLF
jgi:hypothetical protein